MLNAAGVDACMAKGLIAGYEPLVLEQCKAGLTIDDPCAVKRRNPCIVDVYRNACQINP